MRVRALPSLLLSIVSILGATGIGAQEPGDQVPKRGDDRPVPILRTVPVYVEQDPDVPDFLKGKIDKKEYLRLRGEHTMRLRGNPEKLSYDPRNRALQQLMALQSGSDGLTATAEISTQAWTWVGPNPSPNGQTTTRSDPISGRTIEIVVHPTNPDIVYVGAAQGGLYRTLNGGATWTQLFDNEESQAVNSIAFHPTDPTTIFVGTGEAGFSGDSFFGVGVYRVTNAASASPTIDGPFGSAEFRNRAISNIVATMNGGNVVLFVSSSSGGGGFDAAPGTPLPARGLYRCDDAMAATPSFAKLTGLAAGANLPVMDMVFDPTDNNTLVCSVFGIDSIVADQGGIWRTTNALAANPTFTQVLTLAEFIRVELAAQNSSGTVTMLAATGEPAAGATCSNAGEEGQLRRSTDNGATWTAPIGTSATTSANGFCGGQCSYDIAVAMKPNNPNIILLGGSANSTCSDVLIRSTDGSTFGRSDVGLHADTHALAFAPSDPNVVYVGNDGGIWKSIDAGVSWTSLNNATYSATQFQSLALHSVDPDFMIGGTQDNGTQQMQFDGSWRRTDYGDGGFARVDQSDAGTSTVRMYHTYYNVAGQLMAFATTENPAAFEDWTCYGCGCTNTPTKISCSDSAVLFYAPLETGPGTPNTLYYGSDRIYRTANEGTNMSAVSQQFESGVAVSSIGISPQNDSVRIVGLENGRVFKTHNGSNPLTEATPAITGTPTSKYVTDVVIDPQNVNTAWAAFSGFGYTNSAQHLWKTTNLDSATPTWTATWTTGIDVPVNSVVVSPYNSSSVYAGTDIGVFRSTDGGANWTVYGTGLPNASVFDMAYHTPSAKLKIATHGRGIWEIQDCPFIVSITNAAPATGAPGTSVTITGTGFVNVKSVLFGSTSASFTVNSATSITATVPNGATSGSLHVVTQCASASTAFTVPACSGAPTFGGVPGASASGCAIALSWPAATPACGSTVSYNVYRGTSGGFAANASSRIALGLAGTSYVDDAGLTPGTTYYYKFGAVDPATQAETLNASTASLAAPLNGTVPSTTFSDDFEGSPTPPGHVFTANFIDTDATNSWFISTGGLAHNGSSAGRFGDAGGTTYSNCQDERLIAGSPGISLPGGASSIEVRFWLWYELEPPQGATGWDGLRLEYSTDGTTWAIVPDADPGGVAPFITQHGYHPTATLVGLSAGAGACPKVVRDNRATGSPIWTDSSGGWVEVVANFTDLAGSTVHLGLRTFSDEGVADTGIYVDEVRVISYTAGACAAGPLASPALTSRTTWGGADFSGQVKLEWRNPSSGPLGSMKILRKSGSCPLNSGDGSVVLSADNPTATDYGTIDDLAVPAGSHCYALYYYSGTGGNGTASDPLTTTADVNDRLGSGAGKANWAYSTNASNLSPPGMFSGSVFMTSNDRFLHGVNPGASGGDWLGAGPAKSWTPAPMNGPAQTRPLVVPLNTNPVGGATQVAFLPSQDGRVYAFDAQDGSELWASAVMGDGFQGGASLAAREYGIALTGVDLLLLGTRNVSSDNSLRALDAADGSLEWQFTNGGGANGFGIINGSPTIDYANKRAYFATRAKAGGSNHTIWCVSFTESSASWVWSANIGDSDATPIVRNGRVYVGNNSGTVYALDAATGTEFWSHSTSDGFVKGFVVRDSGGRIYFSTNNKVWGVQDNGASKTELWQLAIPSPSPAILMGNVLLVGSGDGSLYRISGITTGTPPTTAIQIGDGNSIVGSPGFDAAGLVYVGTDSGNLFVVTLP